MGNKRKVILANNEIYHLFNHSIADQVIFPTKRELNRVLQITDYYRFSQTISYSKYKVLPKELKYYYTKKFRNSQPLVEIYSFSFISTHFHFLVKQLADKGISTFISKLQNSFAKYFNKKYDRDGSVFKKNFKSKWISTDEEFIHVSRYIHLNPVTSYVIEAKDLDSYPYTSFPFYLTEKSNKLINTEEIIKILGSNENYKKFVLDQVDYQRKLNRIKKLL